MNTPRSPFHPQDDSHDSVSGIIRKLKEGANRSKEEIDAHVPTSGIVRLSSVFKFTWPDGRVIEFSEIGRDPQGEIFLRSPGISEKALVRLFSAAMCDEIISRLPRRRDGRSRTPLPK